MAPVWPRFAMVLVVILSATFSGLTSQSFAQASEMPPATLSLACGGTIIGESSQNVGGGSAPGVFIPSTTVVTQQQRAARVLVEITGSEGRIHLSRPFIPLMHGGGAEDWWPLYDVRIGDEGITARFRLNALDKPRIVIDRMSGDIQISGLNRVFSGNCERRENERKF